MAFGADVANLIVQLKLDDSGFTGKLNNAARTLGRMDQGLSRMGRGAGQVGSGLARLGTVAAAAAAGGLAAVVTTAISFEDAFAGIRKTVDATEPQLEELNTAFRALAREIPLSFEELAGIGETAGALGIARDDILEFTRVVALIGTTTDVTTQDAATSLGQLQNVLGLTADEFDNFGAALVDLGNKGASTESQILGIASRAGAGAKLIGLTTQQTLGWASAVADLGIEVEAGGSSLQNFFVKLIKVTATTNDVTDALDQVTDLGVGGFKKALEEDANGAILTLLEGMKKLDRGAQLLFLKQLDLNDIRITRTILGLLGNTDGLTRSLGNADKSWEKNTALVEEAEKRFATTKSQLKLLGNNMRDIGATIGVELLPIIKELSSEFLTFLNTPEAQKNIKDFAADLASGIRGLITELKGTDFSGIIGGLKIAAEVAKGAFNAFNALPGPVKQLAIAALVANKVSGGAVGMVAKGLSNIAFGGLQAGIGGIFGGRGTTPANPLFVSAIGGIGGAGGAAGAAGRGGGLLGVAKFVLGPLAAIAIGAEIAKGMNEATIRPAANFEQEQFTAVLESGATDRLVDGLSAIEQQWEDADLGETAALLASHLPIIGDALGNVGPKLDEQKRIIREQLLAQGYSNEQIDRMVYQAEQQREQDALYDGRIAGAVEKQVITEGSLVQEARASGIKLQTVAQRVQESRDKIARSNDYLTQIVAKDFSPKLSLQQTINVSATLSAAQAAAAIKVNQIIQSGKGTGLLEAIT